MLGELLYSFRYSKWLARCMLSGCSTYRQSGTVSNCTFSPHEQHQAMRGQLNLFSSQKHCGSLTECCYLKETDSISRQMQSASMSWQCSTLSFNTFLYIYRHTVGFIHLLCAESQSLSLLPGDLHSSETQQTEACFCTCRQYIAVTAWSNHRRHKEKYIRYRGAKGQKV